MRLIQEEQGVICGSIHKVDPDARILLFGSRVDDQARGGGYRSASLRIRLNACEFGAQWAPAELTPLGPTLRIDHLRAGRASSPIISNFLSTPAASNSSAR